MPFRLIVAELDTRNLLLNCTTVKGRFCSADAKKPIAIGLVAGSNFEPSTSSASDLFRAGYHGNRLIPIRRIAANEKVLLAHHWTSSTWNNINRPPEVICSCANKLSRSGRLLITWLSWFLSIGSYVTARCAYGRQYLLTVIWAVSLDQQHVPGRLTVDR